MFRYLTCLVIVTLASALEQSRQWDEEIFTEGKSWEPILGTPRTIIDHRNKTDLPDEFKKSIEDSNNCLTIKRFNGRLFVAWRSAPYHFASSKTILFVMSSPDDGVTWEREFDKNFGRDAREPWLLEINGTLHFYFFQAGTNPIAFQPNTMWRMTYQGETGKWSKEESWGQLGEITWQYGVENGTAYAGSYVGNHYDFTALGDVHLMFNKSSDGLNWEPVDPKIPHVYTGGASEVGWQFDLQGNFYGVLRNEDGDKQSGWGRRIAKADWNDLGNWKFNENQSDPSIIESPRMFRHGNDLYLLGRTDPSGHFENHKFWQYPLPDWLHHLSDLAWYSLRNHGVALWKLNTDSLTLTKLADVPGCGDTAFPSIERVSKHKYVIANYSSPTDQCKDWWWIHGQLSSEGTSIYLMEIDFEEKDSKKL